MSAKSSFCTIYTVGALGIKSQAAKAGQTSLRTADKAIGALGECFAANSLLRRAVVVRWCFGLTECPVSSKMKTKGCRNGSSLARKDMMKASGEAQGSNEIRLLNPYRATIDIHFARTGDNQATQGRGGIESRRKCCDDEVHKLERGKPGVSFLLR